MYIQGMRWDVWKSWVFESSSRTTMSLLWRSCQLVCSHLLNLKRAGGSMIHDVAIALLVVVSSSLCCTLIRTGHSISNGDHTLAQSYILPCQTPCQDVLPACKPQPEATSVEPMRVCSQWGMLVLGLNLGSLVWFWSIVPRLFGILISLEKQNLTNWFFWSHANF